MTKRLTNEEYERAVKHAQQEIDNELHAQMEKLGFRTEYLDSNLERWR